MLRACVRSGSSRADPPLAEASFLRPRSFFGKRLSRLPPSVTFSPKRHPSASLQSRSTPLAVAVGDLIDLTMT